MRRITILWTLFSLLGLWAQEENSFEGTHYLEDQLYVGFTYDFFLNRPDEYQRTGLPVGFHMGFIKDIPLDSRSRFAFGIGAGYVIGTYKHNIQLPAYTMEDFGVINASGTLHTHALELPLVFRWRTSTPEIQPFVRIYAGVRVNYIFYARNIFRQEGENKVVTHVTHLIDPIQYGPYLSVGYGNLNLYFTYSIKPLFIRSSSSQQRDVWDLKEIKMGLRFYIF
jgi:hypothetical protein